MSIKLFHFEFLSFFLIKGIVHLYKICSMNNTIQAKQIPTESIMNTPLYCSYIYIYNEIGIKY